MPISDLFDRAEGYGHTAGSNDTKDDSDWDTQPTVAADPEEALATRIARTLTGRKTGAVAQHSDLYDRDDMYGHSEGNPDDSMSVDLADNETVATVSGSAVALAAVDATVNHELNATYRDNSAPDADMRTAIGFADRTTGWGHTAATDADLDDA